MKRKRRQRVRQEASKRPKTGSSQQDNPSWPLLRYYYPHVSTLRQHLAAKLSKTSKKRCRALLRFGQRAEPKDGDCADDALTRLLDETVVGSFHRSESIDLDAIQRDITVFTQQVSDSTTEISPTQGVLKQSEVGVMRQSFVLLVDSAG